MAYWIHCNKCIRRFDATFSFYIGECGHLECQNCLKSSNLNEGNCSVCSKTCRKIVLSKDMKPDILIFFKPFNVLLEQVKKTYDFQEKQRSYLLNQLSMKYTYVKKELLKSQKVVESQRKDILKLRSMLKFNQTPSANNPQQMAPSARNFLTSTPMSKASRDMNFSISTLGNNFAMRNSTPFSGKPGYAVRTPANISTPQSHTFTRSITPSSAQVVPNSSSKEYLDGSLNMRPFFPNVHRSRQN